MLPSKRMKMSGQMIMIRYMLTARVYVLIFIWFYVKKDRIQKQEGLYKAFLLFSL